MSAAGGGRRVCRVADLADGDVRRFDVDGRPVAVVRIGDDWFAIGDTCSHADVSLSEGELLLDECALECWKHGSAFDLRTGEPTTLPATRPVPVYAVEVDGDDVLVDVGDAP